MNHGVRHTNNLLREASGAAFYIKAAKGLCVFFNRDGNLFEITHLTKRGDRRFFTSEW